VEQRGERGRVIDLPERGRAIVACGAALVTAAIPPGLTAEVAPGALVALAWSEGSAAVSQVEGGPRGAAWDAQGDGLRWRRPGHGVARMTRLVERQRIVRAIREDLEAHGVLEVPAPLLIRGTSPDPAIDSFEVGREYLSTSTEYSLKRMMAGGFDALMTIADNFRRGEVGPLHNPQFTMLEWCRAGARLADIERDVVRFTAAALGAIRPGVETVEYGGHTVQLAAGAWRRLTVRAALETHRGVEVDAAFSPESVARGIRAAGVVVPDAVGTAPFDVLSYLLALVQPHLGTDAPVFLVEWPALLTSSAPPLPGNPAVAERSELFIAGVEIADGFPFLTDPDLQERLFTEANALRAEQGLPPVDIDRAYLDALRQGLPPGAGMALGLDRLVMVLTGASTLRDVMPFAWDER
jgi:lysyl-tRNA synthetase class 2